MPIKKISKFIAFTALFLIPIFPLIVANSYFFPFITGKAFYFRILVELALASWIILAFYEAKYRPRLSPILVGVTIFTFVALLADLLGVNPLRSFWSNFERMEGWITIIHLLAFFLVTTSLFGHGEEGRRNWHHWINFSLFIALIVALYGLGQLLGWFDIHQGSSRIDASLGNAAYMAVYMLMHAGLATYMYFAARVKKSFSSWYKIVYPFLALLFAFEVFQTATRGTILGLIGGVLLSLFLYALLAGPKARKSRLYAGGIIVLVVILGLVFWFNRSSSFVQNSEVLNRLATISLNEAKTQARGYIWPMALKGAMERPLLGWGQENFNYIFNANYDPRMYNQEQWFDRAHSVYLDWLVAGGIIGLVSYLSLYFLLLFALWRSSLAISEKSVLTGLLVGYFIHNIFVFDNLASYVLFFALLGFVHSLRESGQKIFSTKQFSNDAVEYVVTPIVLVLLISSMYFLQIRVIQANTRLIYAVASCNEPVKASAAYFEKALAVDSYTANQEAREQVFSCVMRVFSSQGVPGPTMQAFLNLSSAAVEAQVAATPRDARLYMLAGSMFHRIGQYEEARTLLEKANVLSPGKQSIQLELAATYLNLGLTDKMLPLLEQAYEAVPDSYSARFAYATGLVITGQEKEARAKFNDDPGIFETTQMAQAYLSLKQYDKAIAIYEKSIKDNPTDVDARLMLAKIYYTAGQISKAVSTMQSIAKDRPELKEQVEAIIKEIQK